MNEGKAYDENRGVFTAPVSGFYQFHVHIHTVVEHQAEVRLILNSKQIVSVWADGQINKSTASQRPMSPFGSKSNAQKEPMHEMGSSNSAIIHMEKGEKVYCLLPKAHVLAGLGFTSFSGYLMKADS
ncbi:hypothetical protein FSP39_013640 [Pinctada imbricata]|uniref:C1q domain-containing protein n=1 Tax=Pinctada imbricata TaxID=66713 RepID=A0AA89C8V7_PINIB|nr:hypothetical protein FSP39_013640 [Pinctada imbricata]